MSRYRLKRRISHRYPVKIHGRMLSRILSVIVFPYFTFSRVITGCPYLSIQFLISFLKRVKCLVLSFSADIFLVSQNGIKSVQSQPFNYPWDVCFFQNTEYRVKSSCLMTAQCSMHNENNVKVSVIDPLALLFDWV